MTEKLPMNTTDATEVSPELRDARGGVKVVAYHGTPFTFTEFTESPSGIHFGNLDQAAHAATIKLGKLPSHVFATLEPDSHGWCGRILKVQLSLGRTKRVKDARTAAKWVREIRKAISEGYDSLVYRNDFEGQAKGATDSYVVFKASQARILGRK